MNHLNVRGLLLQFDRDGISNAQNDSSFGYHHGPMKNPNRGWLPLRQAAIGDTGERPKITASDNTEPTPNLPLRLSAVNGLVCDIVVADEDIMCGEIFTSQAEYRRHLREEHPGSTLPPRKGHPSMSEVVDGENALMLWVRSGGWRNARYVKDPRHVHDDLGPPDGYLNIYATLMESLAECEPSFAAKYGTQFHRRSPLHPSKSGPRRLKRKHFADESSEQDATGDPQGSSVPKIPQVTNLTVSEQSEAASSCIPPITQVSELTVPEQSLSPRRSDPSSSSSFPLHSTHPRNTRSSTSRLQNHITMAAPTPSPTPAPAPTPNPLPWQQTTATYRAAALAKIPLAWRLPASYTISLANPTSAASVAHIPRECGILNSHEWCITEDYTAATLASALAVGKLKAVDVATAFCKRAAVAQQLVCCLTETMFESAIERGRELDEFFKKEGRVVGPLHGVPISLKDGFKVAGVASTLGIVSFIDKGLETTNSPLVDILLKLGAILYVKTNIPQTLMTADSENNIFLRTLNPHNPTLTAGGSSGGEGALIALGGSILGIGTDIGGSIRIPSVCCGTYGFKPSSHRVPYSGLASPGKSGSPAFPAVAGPLASNFSDLEFLLKSVIEAKPWDHDGTALAIPWRSALPEKRTLRVGVLAEDPKWACWPPVCRAIATAVDKLRAAGHEIVQLTDAPSVDEGLQMAYASFGLDNSQTMGRNILASGEPFVGSVQRTLDLMTPKEGGWSLEEVFDLNVKKADYFMRWNKVFVANNLDCVLGPGAQTTATPHDTYGHVPYTAVWNTLEYPAVIIPFLHADKNIDTDDLATPDPARPYSATTIDGLPLHVQLVARRYMDEELLQASKIVDKCLKQE